MFLFASLQSFVYDKDDPDCKYPRRERRHQEQYYRRERRRRRFRSASIKTYGFHKRYPIRLRKDSIFYTSVPTLTEQAAMRVSTAAHAQVEEPIRPRGR